MSMNVLILKQHLCDAELLCSIAVSGLMHWLIKQTVIDCNPTTV